MFEDAIPTAIHTSMYENEVKYTWKWHFDDIRTSVITIRNVKINRS